MARISAGRRARQRRALLLISGAMSALVLLAAGSAWGITSYVNGSLGRVDAGTSGLPSSGPLNFLVAGVDDRARPDPPAAGHAACGALARANPTPTRS